MFYESAYRNVAIFYAIQSQSYDILKSIDDESSINWLDIVDEIFLTESNEHLNYVGMCLCELASLPVKYDNFFEQSSKILDLIKESLPKNINTMKSDGQKYSEDAVTESRRSITRYKRWKDKNL